ncbi:MAG: cobalamin biosynthesis protein CbiG [Thermoleophilia bacterium]
MRFDAYLMVDWSARSTPSPRAPSADAVWVAELGGVEDGARYFRTRAAGAAHVRERLLHHVRASRRVLVGFDFPFGYPRGLAAALGLAGAPWRAVWDALGDAIADDDRNRNNRFAVAAGLNARIAGPGPFWGCPPSAAGPHLTAAVTGLFAFPVAGLARLRATEATTRGVQETWKLLGIGSVGSQALLGIPRVRALRDDPALGAVSRVWPFETGLTDRPSPDAGPFVLHAEIWPGILHVPPDAPIRDEAQVHGVCAWAAGRDRDGTLGARFAPALDAATATAVVAEEGWILS